MQLAHLLLEDSRTSLRRLGLMAVVAGAGSATVLGVVNAAAQSVESSAGQSHHVALFGAALAAYVFSQRYVLVVTTDEVERIVDARRQRLVSQLAQCHLQGVEKIGHGTIYTTINADAQTISQTSGSLMLAVQALILIFWVALYLASLSLPTLALVAVVLLVASRIYRSKLAVAGVELRAAHRHVAELHDVIESLLGGFKEVKLSSRRAADLMEHSAHVSTRTAHFRRRAQRALASNFIFSQAAIFVLLGALVFVLPALSDAFSGIVVKALAAVLFLVGPISGIVSAMPQVTVANAAAENLLRLEKLLQTHQERSPAGDSCGNAVAASPAVSRFERIDLQGLRLTRGEGDERFELGPIDLTLQRGELLFITGGNGSGKTSFIKVLTGLYPADSGVILVDGQRVDAHNLQSYRDMFSAVFSDFHLFKTLYGSATPDPQRAAALIDEMEMSTKVRLDGRSFSTTDLSTGQRKRLALVAAQLEDKPILVLDEWAADQDPHFRARFYEQILPRLRSDGVTVIAITHDEKYFHHADRRVHMQEGRIVQEIHRTPSGSAQPGGLA